MSNQHEVEFVRSFIISEKQERYLSLLKNKKGRLKIRFGFNHRNDLNPTYATLIPKNLQSVDSVERLLKKKGASNDCYVLSSNSNTNEEFMALDNALEETLGKGMGTLISCIPGKLAYFELEDINEKYILER